MFARALANFAPRPRLRFQAWLRRHAKTDEDKPYDARRYPWHGAPGGPCDAIDDPGIRHVWLQWGIRMGKTQFGQWQQLFYADTAPRPMMIASSQRKLAVDVTARTYRIIERIPSLRAQLRPAHRRQQAQVDLSDCRIYVAWAGSDSTLADKDIECGHGNEIDKWPHASTATEGSELQRFLSRASNHPNRKYVLESTPSIRDHSAIEKGLHESTNCRYWVPCPHCRKYQTLRLGDGESPGGIVWDRLKDGSHDKDLARRTAHYTCSKCQRRIEDHHRAAMVRAGVWVPEGCGVKDAAASAAVARWYQDLTGKAKGGDGARLETPWSGWSNCPWITGKPARDGVDAGYQISRLYDLSLTWGDIAAEFVSVKGDRLKLHQFINEWLAETWQDLKPSHTWETLGHRLKLDYRRGSIPSAAWFLTAGVDVQEDRCYWIVRAWGPGAMSWLIDWGCIYKPVDEMGQMPFNGDLNQLDQSLIERSWPVLGKTPDGYEALFAAVVNIDTGHRISDVHQFLQRHPGDRVRAVAGDAAVNTGFYRMSVLEKNSRTGKVYEGGLRQWQLNTDAYKADLQDRWNIPPGEPGAWHLPADVLQLGGDYLRQVTNEAPEIKTLPSGRVVRYWKMVKESWGNHYWDCEVYARAAADFVTEGQWSDEGQAAPAALPQYADGPSQRERSRRRQMNRRRRARA